MEPTAGGPSRGPWQPRRNVTGELRRKRVGGASNLGLVLQEAPKRHPKRLREASKRPLAILLAFFLILLLLFLFLLVTRIYVDSNELQLSAERSFRP